MEAFAKWVQTYQAIIAVVLGITGWIINHYFTLRAQEKNFIKQLYNTARLDITVSLREYQKYLNELTDFYMLIWEMHKFGNIDLDKLASMKTNFEGYDLKCFLLIEEYDTLIPELNDASSILLNRHAEILAEISILREALLNLEILDERYPSDNDKIEWIMKHCWDGKKIPINIQFELVNDLIRFLQIKCFSEITGNKIRNNIEIEKTDSPKFIIQDGKLIYRKSNDSEVSQ